MLDKARNHEVRCMEDSFAYVKDKWDQSHATSAFKVGDLVLVSATNFNKIKGSFSGPFAFKALHGNNAIEVELSEELSNKHPTFPVRVSENEWLAEKDIPEATKILRRFRHTRNYNMTK
ncbi:hypothetical protein O181_059843 [Austropuccinia psidii MF-1]|uniref:Uncharacterized protein n=1 Tax=Austropuccinia psidii MF-1 TaxID=1389203 RepID=A0A9Q3EFH9_9BASI|nr:hypothetical protein [Austropuccinia psidii MF-1]